MELVVGCSVVFCSLLLVYGCSFLRSRNCFGRETIVGGERLLEEMMLDGEDDCRAWFLWQWMASMELDVVAGLMRMIMVENAETLAQPESLRAAFPGWQRNMEES